MWFHLACRTGQTRVSFGADPLQKTTTSRGYIIIAFMKGISETGEVKTTEILTPSAMNASVVRDVFMSVVTSKGSTLPKKGRCPNKGRSQRKGLHSQKEV